MTSTAASPMLRDDFRPKLRQQLYEEYPFMKRDALEIMLDSLEAGLTKQAPAMAASLARASFFSLPAELRNSIYALAFNPSGEQQELDFKKSRAVYGGSIYRKARVANGAFGFLTVSRQIYNEALPVFWSNKAVRLDLTCNYEEIDEKKEVVDVDFSEWVDISKLATMGPKQCALVKKVVLTSRQLRRMFGLNMIETLPFTTQGLFDRLGLGSFEIKLSAVEIDRSVLMPKS